MTADVAAMPVAVMPVAAMHVAAMPLAVMPAAAVPVASVAPGVGPTLGRVPGVWVVPSDAAGLRETTSLTRPRHWAGFPSYEAPHRIDSPRRRAGVLILFVFLRRRLVAATESEPTTAGDSRSVFILAIFRNGTPTRP